MENWGLITYRETALLIDDATSPLTSKQRVAYVVAHELAHQWFGNLVTMEWWGDLWLNEGFATWVGYLAVAHLKPEWDFWTNFVDSTVSRAMDLDALESSHPIEVDVANSAEVNEIFDAISYCKGASIIRMLVITLGEHDFREGLRSYLRKHTYANASTKDLWNSLSESSKKNVNEFMYKWTRETGYPVLEVVKKDDKLELRQERFLSTGAKNGDSAWIIPLHIRGKNGEVQQLMLNEKTSSVTLNSDGYVLVNPEYFGFYRTKYDEQLLTGPSSLPAAIQGGQIETINRLGFASDLFALAKAGMVPTDNFLKTTLFAFAKEREESVWSTICSSLSSVSTVFINDANNDSYCKYLISLFNDVYQFLGWKPKEGEPATQGLLRGSVIAVMGRAGHPDVVERCLELVRSGSNDFPPDIRSAVYHTAVSYGGKEIFDIILNKLENAEMHEEAVRCLSALGATKDKECISQLLNLTFTEKIRHNDVYVVYAALGSNRAGRRIAWDFMKERFDDIFKIFGEGQFLLARMISVTTSNFSDESDADEVDKFFTEHKVDAAARNIKQSIESIRSNALWKGRDSQGVAKYLSEW